LNESQDFDDYIFRKSDETNVNLEWYYKCLWKIWNIVKKSTRNDVEWKQNSEDDELVEELWEDRLYKSEFWMQLTGLVDKFLHKKLYIEYIQW
jgi:hypothetical protein